MNCAEAVKVSHYPVEAPRKQVRNTKFPRSSNEKFGSIRVNPRESVAKDLCPQNGNAAGPATPTAFVRGFLRCLITAWRRNDRFGPTALTLSQATSAAFAKASCPFLISRSKISRSRTGKPAVASGPSCSLLRRATNRWGRRPQCPGNQSHLRAFSGMSPGDSPSRITRLPLALPQSFGKLRKLHVSLNPLSVTLLRLATQKSSRPCAETVDDETSLWKTEEN